jgi:hypothetical protein
MSDIEVYHGLDITHDTTSLTVTNNRNAVKVDHGLNIGHEVDIDVEIVVEPEPELPPSITTVEEPIATWTIDGGSEHNLTSDDDIWILAPLIGLDLPPDEQFEVPLSHGDGSILVGRRRLPREIILRQRIWNSSFMNFEQLRRRLLLQWDFSRAGTFHWILPDGTLRKIRARASEVESEDGHLGSERYGRWRIILRAVDPYWSGPENYVEFSLGEAGDNFYGAGLDAPPYVISESTTFGERTINVPSDPGVQVWPTWEIIGPTTHVTMANRTTDRELLVAPDLAPYETLIVRTDPRILAKDKFTKDGVNVWSEVAEQFPDLWSLEPGDQTLEVSALDSTVTTRVRLHYSPRYLTA